MLKHNWAVAALLLAVGAAPPNADARITQVFTDRAAWEAAVVNFQTEAFETASEGKLPGRGAVTPLGVISFWYRDETSGGAPLIQAAGAVNGSIELRGQVGIDNPSSRPADTFAEENLIGLPAIVFAVGGDFSSASSFQRRDARSRRRLDRSRNRSGR